MKWTDIYANTCTFECRIFLLFSLVTECLIFSMADPLPHSPTLLEYTFLPAHCCVARLHRARLNHLCALAPYRWPRRFFLLLARNGATFPFHFALLQFRTSVHSIRQAIVSITDVLQPVWIKCTLCTCSSGSMRKALYPPHSVCSEWPLYLSTAASFTRILMDRRESILATMCLLASRMH